MRLSHDELLQVHRKERKELQAKIQSLKHSVPKGDKKRKKDVAAEVAILEAELEEKHKKDLEEFAALQCDGVANGEPEEKKRQKEVQREKEIAEQEVENQFLPRAVEERELRVILGKLGLAIYEIPSDGNW
ncbi:hypothetical protein HPB49_022852 [Dermacentor silvarum]|uniref:Uncharacterized protein n=1 Tax=Dermacentor silvarum TaxID=543639 RepID=A0ACB8E2Y8_DERSI|nr:hypothetical protein HPB49_022852 [Dermacentor silvarum]